MSVGRRRRRRRPMIFMVAGFSHFIAHEKVIVLPCIQVQVHTHTNTHTQHPPPRTPPTPPTPGSTHTPPRGEKGGTQVGATWVVLSRVQIV